MYQYVGPTIQHFGNSAIKFEQKNETLCLIFIWTTDTCTVKPLERLPLGKTNLQSLKTGTSFIAYNMDSTKQVS